MRGLLILLISGALSAQATASELHALLSAKSVSELETNARETAMKKLLHDGCSAELAARLLPRSCFQELLADHGEKDSTRALRLARVCVQNAKTSRSRLDLSGSAEHLPPECRKATEERLEDLQYMDEARSPETSVMRTSGPELEKTSRD